VIAMLVDGRIGRHTLIAMMWLVTIDDEVATKVCHGVGDPSRFRQLPARLVGCCCREVLQDQEPTPPVRFPIEMSCCGAWAAIRSV
jgi:hypothetical protein